MDHVTFDALTRRASLMALAQAGLAGLAYSGGADARKNKKKGKRKQNNGNANKLCQKQEGQCLDFFTAFCEDREACLAEAEQCCPLTADCDLAGFLLCFDD